MSLLIFSLPYCINQIDSMLPCVCSVTGSLSKDKADNREIVIWKCNFTFLQSFLIIQSRYPCKMCFNCPGIKLEPIPQTLEDKIEHFSSCAHIIHRTAKQVISCRGTIENIFKMSKNEICTCKVSKTIVFRC